VPRLNLFTGLRYIEPILWLCLV